MGCSIWSAPAEWAPRFRRTRLRRFDACWKQIYFAVPTHFSKLDTVCESAVGLWTESKASWFHETERARWSFRLMVLSGHWRYASKGMTWNPRDSRGLGSS